MCIYILFYLYCIICYLSSVYLRYTTNKYVKERAGCPLYSCCANPWHNFLYDTDNDFSLLCNTCYQYCIQYLCHVLDIQKHFPFYVPCFGQNRTNLWTIFWANFDHKNRWAIYGTYFGQKLGKS